MTDDQIIQELDRMVDNGHITYHWQGKTYTKNPCRNRFVPYTFSPEMRQLIRILNREYLEKRKTA